MHAYASVGMARCSSAYLAPCAERSPPSGLPPLHDGDATVAEIRMRENRMSGSMRED